MISFTIETLFFCAEGVQYLIGLDLIAVDFALIAPQSIWGTVDRRFGLQLLPVGYRMRTGDSDRL